MEKKVQERLETKPFHLRKLTKTGGSRTISLGTILPEDWEAVQLYVMELADGVCILKLVQIR